MLGESPAELFVASGFSGEMKNTKIETPGQTLARVNKLFTEEERRKMASQYHRGVILRDRARKRKSNEKAVHLQHECSPNDELV